MCQDSKGQKRRRGDQKKKEKGSENNKLREMLRLQQFYNIFTTNHRWLVVIGSNLKLTARLPFCPNNNN